MKKPITIAILIVVTACTAPEPKTEVNQTEIPQNGITISGTASVGIARDGN